MKEWTLIKTLFCLIVGAKMIFVILTALFGTAFLSCIICFIICYIWIGYVVGYYYPHLVRER